MKELFTKYFWRDVKHTFDEAREEPAADSPRSSNHPKLLTLAEVPRAVQDDNIEPRGVLFDMDGVLYNSGQPVEGAAEIVGWVQSEGIPRLFVTNTTSRSRRDLVAKLAAFGITATEDEILTPAVAAAEWLRAHGAVSTALFVRPSARSEFADLPILADSEESGAGAVVIGDLGELWDFRTLNRAFRLLHHNRDAKLIALGMTRYWMASDGIALDVAPFVVALEHASRRRAMVFGKPGAAFFRAAAGRLGMSPSEVLMIGDDIEADVGGAQAAGLKGALVKTGKFQPADLERSIRPAAVLDSVADLPRWWKNERSGLRSNG